MSSCPLNLSSYPSSSLLPLLTNMLLSPVLFVTLVFLSVFVYVCVCDSSVILNSAWHNSPQVVDTPRMVSNIGRGSIGNWGNSMNIGLSSNFFMDIGLSSNIMSFHRLFMDIGFSSNFFMHIRFGSNLFVDVRHCCWGLFWSRSSCGSSNDRQQDKELHDGMFWTTIPM